MLKKVVAETAAEAAEKARAEEAAHQKLKAATALQRQRQLLEERVRAAKRGVGRKVKSVVQAERKQRKAGQRQRKKDKDMAQRAARRTWDAAKQQRHRQQRESEQKAARDQVMAAKRHRGGLGRSARPF